MKVNIVQTIIAILISTLFAYGFYNFSLTENKIVLSIGSFIFLGITSTISFGCSFELSRTNTNIKTLAILFFFIALLSNILFTLLFFSVPAYVLINGILFLIFMLTTYSVYRAQQ
jgi:hypothetical protein